MTQEITSPATASFFDRDQPDDSVVVASVDEDDGGMEVMWGVEVISLVVRFVVVDGMTDVVGGRVAGVVVSSRTEELLKGYPFSSAFCSMRLLISDPLGSGLPLSCDSVKV